MSGSSKGGVSAAACGGGRGDSGNEAQVAAARQGSQPQPRVGGGIRGMRHRWQQQARGLSSSFGWGERGFGE
ncbi:hypothetical protein CLOP_g17827 [Closterium sp. NIES-67]|nr:hypothetical protein CLOP_g17827 [Closterium sp. NIES-67]